MRERNSNIKLATQPTAMQTEGKDELLHNLTLQELIGVTGGGILSDIGNGAAFLAVGITGETLKSLGATQSGQNLVNYAYNNFSPK